MMWGRPENPFSRETSSSLSLCSETVSPMAFRTGSNEGSISATEENFWCATTRIIANCPERIVQVESSMLHPISKSTRVTSATIPGRSLPTTLSEKCPIPRPPPSGKGCISRHDTTASRGPTLSPARRTGCGSAGEEGEERTGRQDADLLPAHRDEPLPLELLQGAGEGLRDGAEAGGEDVLAHREVDRGAVARRDAAALHLLGQVEDQARLHVPQGEVLHEVGHPPEPPGEGGEHPDGKPGVPLQQVDECELGGQEQLGVREGLGVCGVRPPLEDGGLGETLARLEDVEDLLLPLLGQLEHLHLAGLHDEEAVRAVPFPEDRLLPRVLPGHDEGGHPAQVVVRQGREQGRLAEGLR